MLLVFRSVKGLRFGELSGIYGHGLREEIDFFRYLRSVFFRTHRAMYCVWEEQGRYCSALRLEPFEDGLILAGLETPPAFRRKGYGKALVQAALEQVGPGIPVYAHIHHQNAPSIALHLSCGFQKIKDTSTLLNGTVTSAYGTYRWCK